MHNAAAQSAPAGSAAQSAPAGPGTLPDGPGKAIVLKSCTACHDAQQATSKLGTVDDWTQTVNDMLSKGADLSDDDAATVVQYLAAHYGRASKPANGQVASPATAAPATAAQPSSANGSPSGAAAAPPDSSSPVNVNKADAQELESSLGLSAAEANAIIQYRQQHGDFKTWQEVSSVPGVAADKIKDNQKRLVF